MSAEPEKYMLKSYRDGAKRTTGYIARTCPADGSLSASSLHPLPVKPGRVAGGALVPLPDADDSLGRVG